MKDFKKFVKEAYLGNPLNESYMGNKGDEVMITNTKKPDGDTPGNWVLEKPDGSAMVDMFFDSKEAAKKYAKGKGLKLVPGFKEDIEEATDFNDPALVKARASQMKRDKIEADEKAKQTDLDKKYGKSFMDKLEAEIVLKQQLDDLKSEREQIMIDMEQEAEPEGGKIADEYGSRLNDIDSRMGLIQKDIDDLRMYESVNEEDEDILDKILSGKFDPKHYKRSKYYDDVRADLAREKDEELLNEDKKPTQVNIAVVDGFGVYSVKVKFEDGSTEKFRSEEEAEKKYNLDGIPRQEFEMDVSESVNEGRSMARFSFVDHGHPTKVGDTLYKDGKAGKVIQKLDWKDAFNIEFDDGTMIQVPFSSVKGDKIIREDKYLKNQDSYIKVTEPRFRKDKNNPNFLSAYINYDTGPGVGIALGKETMAGQIRRLSSAEALRQMEIIAKKLEDSYDLEDIDVTDLENGVVELFAVSDDFIDMDPRSELSMAMLGENQKYDDEDIVIYDGEEHIIMRKDGNMVYIRPLEDSAILGKKDEIKVPARALAYKSDLDKMYDEYKPKDEVNEEFSSTEQKMIKQIQSYKKRDSAMVNLPSKVRDFYFKNKEKIDALNENMGEWPKELTSRYSDEYRFELEKVSPTYQDKPGRAKYRVIDIESGELKGTPVFGTPESLIAFADDLIKPQGGTQSTNLGESLQESLRKKLQERLK